VTESPPANLLTAKALAAEDVDKACDLMDDMIRLEGEKIETLKKLKRCFRIANLAGVHPNDMKGQISLRFVAGKTTYRPWVGAKMRVDRVGDGQDIVDRFLDRAGVQHEEYWLTDVHKELWPVDVLRAYERHQKEQERRKAGG